jgi:hypothetical protein
MMWHKPLACAVHANGKLNRKVLNHFFQVAPHKEVTLCFLRIKQKVIKAQTTGKGVKENLIAITNTLDMRKSVLQTCSTEFAVKFGNASLSVVIGNCSLCFNFKLRVIIFVHLSRCSDRCDKACPPCTSTCDYACIHQQKCSNKCGDP